MDVNKNITFNILATTIKFNFNIVGTINSRRYKGDVTDSTGPSLTFHTIPFPDAIFSANLKKMRVSSVT